MTSATANTSKYHMLRVIDVLCVCRRTDTDIKCHCGGTTPVNSVAQSANLKLTIYTFY